MGIVIVTEVDSSPDPSRLKIMVSSPRRHLEYNQ
jgi:hypothetical protein